MVSTANGKPMSGGSQFFIVVADSPTDGGYSLFGQVIQGIEVADRIAAVERDLYGRHGPTDRPLQDVVIGSIRIEGGEPAGDAAPSPLPESHLEWDEGA
jgi:peptidyl-prolyl cis-trans isomerase B (cyclophilin B)